MLDRLQALEYHELTKHSVVSVQNSGHFLDWENQPLPFKIYSTLDPIALPRDFEPSAAASADTPDLKSLARWLHYTAGIIRTKVHPGGHAHHFRAAACTGALYHIDLYVVCAELAGLEAGVYHFGPHDFALRCLRRGDYRQVLVDASGHEAATARSPVVLVCTSTFWRNAWKYESRTYRHCFWDTGTMLANMLAVVATTKTPARIVVGFADGAINQLLALDTKREVAVACVALGRADGEPPAAPALMPVAYETLPLSRHEVDYPAIRAAHAGSNLDTSEEARQWRQHAWRRPVPEPRREVVALVTSAEPAPAAIEQVITRRGSTRRFAREAITYEALSRIVHDATVDVDADFSAAGSTQTAGTALLNDLYLIVNAVDGLAPGAYVYRSDCDGLELLKAGDFRRAAGHLDLGQELAADASVNFYLLCDLDRIVERFGSRGYRAAALEAAVIGGRIYLAAYGLGLGATGLTFFDDDVTAFFSPHAAGKGVMFLTAVGRPKRGRVVESA